MCVVAQDVHCTNPGGFSHIDCNMNGAFLELDKLLECQPHLRVTKEPHIGEEVSLAGAISLVQMFDGKRVSPPNTGVVNQYFFGNSVMGPFKLHRQFEDEGARAGESLEGVNQELLGEGGWLSN